MKALSTTAVFLLAWSCFSIFAVRAGGPTEKCAKELQFNNYVSNCYYKANRGQNYVGKVSVSKSGLDCQRWNKHEPHEIDKCFEKHPHNYCRNPLGRKTVPYCYTMSSTVKWEACNIPMCSSLTPQTETPTLPPTPNATSHIVKEGGLSIGVIGLAVGLCTIFVILFIVGILYLYKYLRRRRLSKGLPYPAKDMELWQERDKEVKKVQRKTALERRKRLESIDSSGTSETSQTH